MVFICVKYYFVYLISSLTSHLSLLPLYSIPTGIIPTCPSSLVPRPYPGVSFIVSQKIPVWIMEFEKASNSTGFTTYPLAPDSYAALISGSSREDVTTTTGIFFSGGICFYFFQDFKSAHLWQFKIKKNNLGWFQRLVSLHKFPLKK